MLPSPDLVPVQKRLRTFSARFHDFRPVRADTGKTAHKVTVMKLLHRRQFLHLAAGAAALPAVSGMARVQAYPTRPITIIVPFAAGGPTDVTARVIGERMSRTLGQPFIIENIVGAGGPCLRIVW